MSQGSLSTHVVYIQDETPPINAESMSPETVPTLAHVIEPVRVQLPSVQAIMRPRAPIQIDRMTQSAICLMVTIPVCSIILGASYIPDYLLIIILFNIVGIGSYLAQHRPWFLLYIIYTMVSIPAILLLESTNFYMYYSIVVLIISIRNYVLLIEPYQTNSNLLSILFNCKKKY